MLKTLAGVNWLLFDEKKPNFLIVRDLPFLRSCVYDPEQILSRHLFARTFCLYPNAAGTSNPVPTFEMIGKEAHGTFGRLKFFSAALCEFIAADLSK